MNTKGLPQTPAPSSGMRRPSRNEEILTDCQKQSWNVNSSLFLIKVSHALWPSCSRRMQELPSTVMPFGWAVGGKGYSVAPALCGPKVRAYPVVFTGPPSITCHVFLKPVLITCSVFLKWRVSSAWAYKGRWDSQESENSSCILPLDGFLFCDGQAHFVQSSPRRWGCPKSLILLVSSRLFPVNVHLFGVHCPETRWTLWLGPCHVDQSRRVSPHVLQAEFMFVQPRTFVFCL